MPNPVVNPENWIVVLATIAVVSVCVGLHYEVLSNCSRLLPYVSHQRRRRILVLILIILVTHVVEMWVFALGYLGLVQWEQLGTLDGLEPMRLTDYAYYSAMVYTTVGFGDIVPMGPIRFMTGMEALTGLVMITWSASYTFLGMHRYWRPD